MGCSNFYLEMFVRFLVSYPCTQLILKHGYQIVEDKIPAYSGPCLFVGGADSDYIPVSDHEEIK